LPFSFGALDHLLKGINMSRLVVPTLVSAICLASVGAASAQDLAKNLYLRLDTGASFTTEGNRSFGSIDQGNSYTVGGGVGYRFTPNFRTDLTLGYRGDYGFDQSGGGVRARADLESLVGLVNGYYDIGTYAGFTPYVGAGIGVADNHYGRTRVATTGGTALGSINGHSNTEFAWQATGGVSYSVTPNWAIDFGYHYLDMGTAQTGSVFTVGGVGLATGSPLKGDLQAHEVSVGLRYSF
jgi:opacity protein-like surface antigen